MRAWFTLKSKVESERFYTFSRITIKNLACHWWQPRRASTTRAGVENEANQRLRWGRLLFSISPNMTCPLKIKAKETAEANGKRHGVLNLGRDELQPSAAARLWWHLDWSPWFSRERRRFPPHIWHGPEAQLTLSRLNITGIKILTSVHFSYALCRPRFHYCTARVILF